jgi:hypothetical protein
MLKNVLDTEFQQFSEKGKGRACHESKTVQLANPSIQSSNLSLSPSTCIYIYNRYKIICIREFATFSK